MDKDLAKVWAFGTATFAVLDWSTVDLILKCLLTLTVLGYTLRKWYLNEKNVKAGKPFEETEFNEKYGD